MIAGLPDDVAVVFLADTEAGDVIRHGWLSDTERERVASFHHPRRRRAFVLGRAAARLAAAAMKGVPVATVDIVIEDSGAVALPGSRLKLSIAHSGAAAAAVVSSRRVGIDLERVREVGSGLFDRISSQAEQQRLIQNGLPRPALTCWTLKEAVLKGIGSGLRISPRQLEIDLAGEWASVLTPDNGVWDARVRSTEEYVLAVAWNSTDS